MAAAASAPSGAWSVASALGSWKLVIPLTERSSSSQRQAEAEHTRGGGRHRVRPPFSTEQVKQAVLGPADMDSAHNVGAMASNQRNFAGQ